MCQALMIYPDKNPCLHGVSVYNPTYWSMFSQGIDYDDNSNSFTILAFIEYLTYSRFCPEHLTFSHFYSKENLCIRYY
jgi:hypothetical protein